MATTIDRNEIKQAIRELIREEPDFLRTILVEFVAEEKERLDQSVPEQDAAFEQSLRDVFTNYGETFKRLA